MKANELRIGNYAYDIDLNQEFEIQAIDIVELQAETIDFYKPIELTEEWLIKFGFKTLDKYTFVKGRFFIHKISF